LVVRTATPSATAPACAKTSFAIANGGFESGSFAPWVPAAGPGVSETVVAGGAGGTKYAARLDFDAGAPGSPLIKQPYIPVCPASNYSIGFVYRVPYTAPNCIVRLGFGVESYVFADIPLNETNWRHYSFDAPSFADTYGILIAFIDCEPDAAGKQSNGTVFLDSFSIEPIPGTTEYPGCPRPVGIANGGFEEGFQDWTGIASPNVNYSVVSPGYGPGSKYLFQADFYPPADPSDDTHLTVRRYDYNLCIAYNYTFSFDYRFENYDYAHHPRYCTIQFQATACGLFPPGGNTIAKNYPPKNNWTHAEYNCRGQVPGYPLAPGQNDLSFFVNCEDSAGIAAYNYTKFSVQLDNVAIKQRPVTTYY
jgi:hypothetical protein